MRYTTMSTYVNIVHMCRVISMLRIYMETTMGTRHQVRKCEICGKEFIPTRSTQRFCSSPHKMSCAICGDTFYRVPKRGQTRYACSKRSCRQALREQTNIERYGSQNPAQSARVRQTISRKLRGRTVEQRKSSETRRRATNMSRYGGESPLHSESIKKKSRDTSRQRYGVDNPAQSDNVKRKMRETNIARHGVEYSFQSEDVKKKIADTNRERYGTEHPRWRNSAIRQQAERTNVVRYGFANPAMSRDVQEKIRRTTHKHYNVDSAFQADIVKRKISATIQQRYGVDNPAQSDDVKRKMRDTNIARYGVANPMMSAEVQEKLRTSMRQRYGVDNPSQQNVLHMDEYVDMRSFVERHDVTVRSIATHFHISEGAARQIIRKHGLDDLVVGRYSSSMLEELFAHTLSAHGIDSTIYTRNDRSVLRGKELDFYFPQHKIAVEISSTSTHNTLKGWGSDVSRITRSYHKDKFLACAVQGVELLTLFDWHDWDKTIEMLVHRLNVKSQRIGARKCTISHGTLTPELRAIINSWHLLGMPQNTPRSTITTTLIYREDIVGIAAWAPYRGSTDCIELKRMVFKPGVTIQGGASKMLKSLMSAHPEINKVITFSDCDFGTGGVYQRIGFSLVEEGKPTLNFYHPRLKKHVKYLSLVKQGANRLLKDIAGYIPVPVGNSSLSNVDIILSYGFLPVYDCGYRKWELTR